MSLFKTEEHMNWHSIEIFLLLSFFISWIGESSDFSPLSLTNQAVVHTNGSLYLESIVKEDEGMYKCNITNGIGNALVKTVMVRVIGMILEKL